MKIQDYLLHDKSKAIRRLLLTVISVVAIVSGLYVGSFMSSGDENDRQTESTESPSSLGLQIFPKEVTVEIATDQKEITIVRDGTVRWQSSLSEHVSVIITPVTNFYEREVTLGVSPGKSVPFTFRHKGTYLYAYTINQEDFFGTIFIK